VTARTQLTTSALAHTIQLRAEGLEGFDSIILTNGLIDRRAISLKLPRELFPFVQIGDPGLVVSLTVVRIAVEEVPDQPTSGLILPSAH